ncbi:sugar phosphorylase [Luteococcus sp. H138]|uniref:sugar phosphorylase n=1 Tax=unclassified Luteococcus TaxID=2639923 RepID=UPI00313A84C2
MTLDVLVARLYPQRSAEVSGSLYSLMSSYVPKLHQARAGQHVTRRRWSQKDAILITYADMIRSRQDGSPLATLTRVLPEVTQGTIPTVHLLPFFPWSSDDGFSVVDYLSVDPAVGSWQDVADLAQQADLMFDAVINHVSAESRWFQSFLAGDPEFRSWFITVDKGTDISAVVRPRTLPLLTEFPTARGPQLVWTTFSADQVDLDYGTPEVLLAIIQVLLEYVARGASVIRLDAVTYLWKKLGTTCVHLPETHAAVQLIRSVFDELAPWVSIITETNVPHAENVSYFGDGHDEAQLVYNFALPPLVLHSLQTADGTALSRWASSLAAPSADTCFFNFLASHDGIGVRGAEGILTPEELTQLARRVEEHGGLVGYRTAPDGTALPYELNSNLFDAINRPDADEPLDVQVRRFMTAQSIMLSLPGVPGIYLHSLVGSRGWPEGVAQTGMNRTINREKLDAEVLLPELADPTHRRGMVIGEYRRLLRVRASLTAFSPDAPSEVLDVHPGLFAIRRGTEPPVVCIHNLTPQAITVPCPGTDIISGQRLESVPAWGHCWIIEE